jgi:hypothetical protein
MKDKKKFGAKAIQVALEIGDQAIRPNYKGARVAS